MYVLLRTFLTNFIYDERPTVSYNPENYEQNI